MSAERNLLKISFVWQGLRVAETLRDDCAVVLLGYDTELTYESWKAAAFF